MISVLFLSQDEDPEIFWSVDSHVVHTALAMPGAPIPQGMCKSDGIMKCTPWRLASVHTLVHNVFVMCCDCVLFLYLLPGPNPVQSSADFKEFAFNELCTRTPLNVKDNGVLLTIENRNKVYVHDCLQRDEAGPGGL